MTVHQNCIYCQTKKNIHSAGMFTQPFQLFGMMFYSRQCLTCLSYVYAKLVIQRKTGKVADSKLILRLSANLNYDFCQRKTLDNIIKKSAHNYTGLYDNNHSTF